jgi:hypothetical protein
VGNDRLETGVVTLSPQQQALLERVCLKRYQVRFSHYMGSFQPNESIDIIEDGQRIASDTFRPATAYALHAAGLARFSYCAPGASWLKPTPEGMAAFRAMRETRRSNAAS